MFRRHKKRPINIVFVIFRLFLSITMFIILLAGLMVAYKHFSGLNLFKIDPQAVILGIMTRREDIGEFLDKIPGLKGKLEVRSKNQNISLEDLVSYLPPPTPKPSQPSQPIFSFMLFADSHNDNTNLKRALTQAIKDYPEIEFVIGLGDYTDVGTQDELKKAKVELDSSGLRYFLTSGDHDRWDSRNKNLEPSFNFNQIFGPTYQTFNFENFKFIILYNSDNYQGLGETQLAWLSSELQRAKQEGVLGILVFLHEPLYHPSSDHVMGRVEKKLKDEARNIIRKFKEAQVNKVFTGDIHYFSEYQEPETGLLMVTIGAVTSLRNSQAPRFAVVSVFDDGSTKVEDVEIK